MRERGGMPDTAEIQSSVAGSFVAARLAAQALAAYPGPLPGTLADAYARQDAAIALWPDGIAGWKVGGIPEAWAVRVGDSRLLGPIFGHHVWRAHGDAVTPLPVIPGGFAAVEAEYVFVLAADIPAQRLAWSAAEAAEVTAELRVGVELAGSPLATINDLGPAAVVSDFGNNAGLLLGPPIADWRSRALSSLTCEVWVSGRRVGRGGAASVPGGPLSALAFALGCCAQRDRALKAGDLISTGASTGIHRVRVGDAARAEFAGIAELRCCAVRATSAAPRRTP
jgi:2-keto-4-pentenoate hydratase